jgi:aspartate beta-hydroxylase
MSSVRISPPFAGRPRRPNNIPVIIMPLTPDNARALAQAGIAALHNGDARAARHAFEQIAAAGQADASAYLGLAYACIALNDPSAAMQALDQALELEPQNLRVLMLKADQLAAKGDTRAASSFYRAMVRFAPPVENLPPDLQQALSRARAMCDRYAQQFESYLQERLGDVSAIRETGSPRFAQSLEIMFGRKTIYVQDPQSYYFPELPQIQFYERHDFPWLDRLEAATASIREELRALLNDDSAFQPYVQAEPNRPRPVQSAMLDNPDWSAFYLWKNGQIIAKNAERFPRTMAALAEAPVTRIPGRSPSILFSQLRPGARIPPHTGYVNTRLIGHLPLIVPPRCGFRVGNETREWVEGKAWLFDDTIEHEAWNLSDQTRVILLFEIWRPELSAGERKLVSAMFEAIDLHRGAAPEENI